MPFVSDKQRRFMYAKHPDIAKKWSQEAKAKSKKTSGRKTSSRRSGGGRRK